jgi:hypothetical protein
MASDKWKAKEELHDVLRELIGERHSHLADIMDDIVILFKEKASKKGGAPVFGKTSKAPAILSVLGEREYKFVLEMGWDVWTQLDESQSKALLDHLLFFIGGVEVEESGEMKYFLREPDIYYFSEEIEVHGHWRPDLSPQEEEQKEEEDTSDVPDLLDLLGDA